MEITQLALIAVFVAAALLSGSVASFLLNRNVVERRRLKEVIDAPSKLAPVPEVLPLANEEPDGVWQDLSKVLLLRSNKELSRLQTRMARAGIKTPGANILFSIAEMVLPFAFGGITYLLHQPEPPLLWVAVLLTSAIGFFLPGMWLDRRLGARQREIENGLPDALDLMIVCIEAGSGIDQAIVKTGDELSFTYPALGDELRLITSEIRAGKSRIDAFKSFAQRTKVDDVRALVAMLIQTDRFGTSIGQALRSHADTSRTKRRQRAEEATQKVGVKLVFPLVLFFFPALYVVVLGPAIIQFVRGFK
ncbi:MAG: type II secretion system F family protein [Vicinamibacterales bacterium]